MKIGIVSYNKYTFYGNYGSLLQSYALYHFLKNLGYNVEIIDYRPGILKHRKTWFPYSFKELIYPSVLIDAIYNEPCHIIRKIKFDTFIKKYLRFSRRKYNPINFGETNKNYDVIVFGSDTIWDIKQTAGFDAGFFGDGFNGKKIGYSISAADCAFNKSEFETLFRYVKTFKALSFRDDSVINVSLDKQFKTTLDPTLLFDGDFYKNLVKRNNKRKKYILYFSLNNNKTLDDYVLALGKSKHLKIVCLSRFLGHAWKFHRNYHVGIEGFLSLIYNAEIIITNSFHGTVFSLLFNKEFYVYKRPGGNNKLSFLLAQLGLEDRFIDLKDKDFGSSINYGIINKKIVYLRNESKNFLIEVLEGCDQ